MFELIPDSAIEGFFVAWKYVYQWMPLWLPILCLWGFFNAWVYYKRTAYWNKLGYVLLEIKLPKEVYKSPLAMEVVLGALSQPGGESTWIDRIWEGKTRDWFSLEIVSHEGKIHFYIWTRPKHKNLLESQIYSQYPEVEIYEVSDYTVGFNYIPGKTEIWGCEFALTQPDPYPIKTYVDYGLDQGALKEEQKVDPMTPLLEFLGSITQGQNIWIQILIRAHKKERLLDVFGEKEDRWKDEAKNIIKEIQGDKDKKTTGGDEEKISALERSISKTPFDCGIRAVYLTEKDKFNSANIGGIAGGLKQFGSLNLNGFKPVGWLTIFDYPWKEWFGAKESLKPILLEEYKLRRFFYSPHLGSDYYGKPFVLNSEELATIFHFPGSVSRTPTFDRLPSKKSEAPANLPV